MDIWRFPYWVIVVVIQYVVIVKKRTPTSKEKRKLDPGVLFLIANIQGIKPNQLKIKRFGKKKGIEINTEDKRREPK
jgi:hypothetical protein